MVVSNQKHLVSPTEQNTYWKIAGGKKKVRSLCIFCRKSIAIVLGLIVWDTSNIMRHTNSISWHPISNWTKWERTGTETSINKLIMQRRGQLNKYSAGINCELDKTNAVLNSLCLSQIRTWPIFFILKTNKAYSCH